MINFMFDHKNPVIQIRPLFTLSINIYINQQYIEIKQYNSILIIYYFEGVYYGQRLGIR